MFLAQKRERGTPLSGTDMKPPLHLLLIPLALLQPPASALAPPPRPKGNPRPSGNIERGAGFFIPGIPPKALPFVTAAVIVGAAATTAADVGPGQDTFVSGIAAGYFLLVGISDLNDGGAGSEGSIGAGQGLQWSDKTLADMSREDFIKSTIEGAVPGCEVRMLGPGKMSDACVNSKRGMVQIELTESMNSTRSNKAVLIRGKDDEEVWCMTGDVQWRDVDYEIIKLITQEE